MSTVAQNDNLLNKEANKSASDSTKAGKYIPPHVRKQMEEAANKAVTEPVTSNEPRRNERSAASSAPRSNWNDQRSSSSSSFDRYGRSSSSYERRGDSRYGGSGYGRSGGYHNRTAQERWEGFLDSRHDPEGVGSPLRINENIERTLFVSKSTGINFDDYDDIPVKCSGSEVPEPIESFDQFDLGSVLSRNIGLSNFTRPTPVQKHAIPIVINGRDLMGCAQTGSGKTGAFLFPIISRMLYDGCPPDPTDSGSRKVYPRTLILSPTRELAIQIHNEAQKFTYSSPCRSVVVYGGAEGKAQLQDLERGCDILVATPGRLVDFLERKRISLSQIRYLILDEADRMLDMGFTPQIRHIVEQEDMPPKTDRQTLMFSATFPREIQRLAADFLFEYIYLQVGRAGSATQNVTQKIEYVQENEKRQMLFDIVKPMAGLTLVFVETKRSADALEDYLYEMGLNPTSIHGDRSQQEREAALKSFKSHRTPILVATDVCARGLDIPNVTQVINYDLPQNIEDYVHRIGRTGRAGNVGIAIGFINEKNINIAHDLHDILVEANQEIPPWYENFMRRGGQRRGGGGRGRGGRFGAHDHRRDNYRNTNNRNSHHGSGNNNGWDEKTWGGSANDYSSSPSSSGHSDHFGGSSSSQGGNYGRSPSSRGGNYSSSPKY